METHLREREHYEDCYDRITVESCRRSEGVFLDLQKQANNVKQARLKAAVASYAWEIKKLFLTLDWYNRKESTIAGWMRNDEARDRMLETASPPRNILCNTCFRRLEEDSRTIWERNGMDTVLFFMRCRNDHWPMKGVYSDGTEHEHEAQHCPKCKATLNHERLPSNEDTVKTRCFCSSCDYEDIDLFTLGSSSKAEDPAYLKDCVRFCLSGKALEEAQAAMRNIEDMKSLLDEFEHREEHKKEYDAVAALNKLTIPQVKEKLTELFTTQGYTTVTFEKPNFGRTATMDFSVEKQSTDNERASTHKLQKLVRVALRGSNWRLVTEGVSYRLGVLSGRLRVYESEEDLLKLVKNKENLQATL